MKLKIAFVSYEYPPDRGLGGIATYTSEIAKLLASSGLVVHVFASSSIREGLYIDGDVCIHWVKSNDPKTFREQVVEVFRQVHDKILFDLIESPEIHANALLLKEALSEIPLVVRLHAPNYLVEKMKKQYV